MSSRFLVRLEAEIAVATDRVSAGCLQAKRASYFARQGDFASALKVLGDLRGHYDHHPDVRIAVWLNLVEGLVAFFTNMGREALDKFRRAHALAAAAKYLPLEALSAGWIAHFEFGRHEIESMQRNLERSFCCASSSDHDAWSRSSLVCAAALHLAGRYDLARPWYEKARIHANIEGDDATISALMHNRVCMAVMNLRQAVLTGTETRDDALNVLLGVSSTSSYDQLVGAVSLNALIPILQANTLSLRGQPEQALTLYLAHLRTAQAQGLGRMLAWMQADIAWCRLQAGEAEAAYEDAVAARTSLLEVESHVDDRAAAHSRLAQVFSALGSFEIARYHQDMAAAAWHQFSELQKEYLVAVGRIPVVKDAI